MGVFLAVTGMLFSSCASVPRSETDVVVVPPPTLLAPPAHEVSKHPSLPAGLPAVGKWMIKPDGHPADWLGAPYRGKRLREPINVILVDPHAKSVEDAKVRLAAACTRAGYPSRRGHSSGYFGWMADQLYGQLPEEKNHAFSSGPFEFDNNHGRIFGPRLHSGRYYFVAALSRENVAPFRAVKHAYDSFDRARDHFSQSLDERTSFKIRRYVLLENALIGDAEWTTGDHDGVAVMLEATQ